MREYLKSIPAFVVGWRIAEAEDWFLLVAVLALLIIDKEKK